MCDAIIAEFVLSIALIPTWGDGGVTLKGALKMGLVGKTEFVGGFI